MTHAVDDIPLDHHLAVSILVRLVTIAFDILDGRHATDAMHIRPLLHQLDGIVRIDRHVGRTLPDRYRGPRPLVARRFTYELSPLRWRQMLDRDAAAVSS